MCGRLLRSAVIRPRSQRRPPYPPPLGIPSTVGGSFFLVYPALTFVKKVSAGYTTNMMKIVQKESPVLRQIAETVSQKDFGSKKLHEIIERMSDALDSQEDGVAIAAPQIGVPLRIFVVSGMLFEEKGVRGKNRVFINPKITRISKDAHWAEEGCLSVRWQYGEVSRAKKATVRAYDEHGKVFTLGGSGLLAQIFQHEMDHLDGVLFVDKARNLRDIPPSPPVNA